MTLSKRPPPSGFTTTSTYLPRSGQRVRADGASLLWYCLLGLSRACDSNVLGFSGHICVAPTERAPAPYSLKHGANTRFAPRLLRAALRALLAISRPRSVHPAAPLSHLRTQTRATSSPCRARPRRRPNTRLQSNTHGNCWIDNTRESHALSAALRASRPPRSFAALVQLRDKLFGRGDAYAQSAASHPLPRLSNATAARARSERRWRARSGSEVEVNPPLPASLNRGAPPCLALADGYGLWHKHLASPHAACAETPTNTRGVMRAQLAVSIHAALLYFR
ncbi:hypothetical protein B0H15DRAFT_945780 [Mycena belliarum]|uniref:Uncharacterized protein n=1 Tax=Mycena belliarum TaxID=1033014 RepID=A0AAD6UFD7_9AGAR|nr:hypothetical protein B0H15DRAFT_945780 [Mycena belliae]